MPDSFVFILNQIDFQDEFPVEVIPKHFFQKADAAQIGYIGEILARLYPYPLVSFPYEYNTREVPGDHPGSVSWERTDLDPQDWRYWIISFEGSNSEIEDLRYAAALPKNDLEFGFTVMGDMPGVYSKREDGYAGYGWKLAPLISYLDKDWMSRISPARITSSDIMRVGESYRRIKQTVNDQNDVRRALKRFDDLKSLPRHSELVVLGLFSVIERLITHSPRGTDSSDSLTHQIRTKVPLLRKRFERSLKYEAFFGRASEDKIWRRLYEYRSRIAHGEPVDIEGRLQILKSRGCILNCLQETAKLLLLLALEEPVLLADLKLC